MAERKTQYNKVKKPKLPDSVELEAKKEAEPKPTPAEKPKKEEKPSIKVKVTASNGLNVRSDPRQAASIVAVLPFEETVEVKEVRGEWGNLGYGWIMLKFTDYKK